MENSTTQNIETQNKGVSLKESNSSWVLKVKEQVSTWIQSILKTEKNKENEKKCFSENIQKIPDNFKWIFEIFWKEYIVFDKDNIFEIIEKKWDLYISYNPITSNYIVSNLEEVILWKLNSEIEKIDDKSKENNKKSEHIDYIINSNLESIYFYKTPKLMNFKSFYLDNNWVFFDYSDSQGKELVWLFEKHSNSIISIFWEKTIVKIINNGEVITKKFNWLWYVLETENWKKLFFIKDKRLKSKFATLLDLETWEVYFENAITNIDPTILTKKSNEWDICTVLGFSWEVKYKLRKEKKFFWPSHKLNF